MRLSLCTTSDAPMCWVMPPRSPAATRLLRIASSRLGLPWSTWPMIVTTGARGPRASGAAAADARSAIPLWTVAKPSSAATNEAVSKSIDWLMLAKMPLRISSLITSAWLTPSVSARSLTTTDEGSSTGPVGRTTTGAWVATPPLLPAPRRRWGRGPRRGMYLRGGMRELTGQLVKSRVGAERSADTFAQASRIVAGGRVAQIGAAPGRPAGRVERQRAINAAHDAGHRLLRVHATADGTRALRLMVRH